MVIAVLSIGLATMPAQAAQSEHQRQLIKKAIKEKQEAKQQQVKTEGQEVRDNSSETSPSGKDHTSN